MKTIQILLTLLNSLILNYVAFGDSPLTSTNFSIAYSNELRMFKTLNANGLITDELMDYCINSKNPVEIKMAIINKLGWDIKGKKNAAIFLNYLKNKRGYSTEADLLKKGTGDELLCMAYQKAMDNYYDVNDAIRYSAIALTRNYQSYTYQIIVALIKAQKALGNEKNWCQVYQLTDDVRKNASLARDMKNESSAIIFEYVDLYKHNCKQ